MQTLASCTRAYANMLDFVLSELGKKNAYNVVLYMFMSVRMCVYEPTAFRSMSVNSLYWLEHSFILAIRINVRAYAHI